MSKDRNSSGGINNGYWDDDVPQYFSIIHPREFDAAIEQASIDGSIRSWTWAMLLGKVPPPGYSWTGQKETEASTPDNRSRIIKSS